MHLMRCKNAFLHQMHLMQKCCVFCFAKNKDAALTFCWCVALQKCIFASNAFLHQMHFCKANQNVRKRQNAFWLCKNAFDAYILLVQKCIWCYPRKRQNAFWRTFSKGKCSAKQNVTNAFDALQKCIFASNAFDAARESGKMHFCKTKCYKCIWCCPRKRQNAFWQRVHFPLENVQHHILRSKMFSITFSFGKCSAPTKCYKCIFTSNAFLHSQNAFCRFLTFWFALQKCIWCKNAFDAEHFPKENVQHQQNVRAASLFFAKQKTQHFCKPKC